MTSRLKAVVVGLGRVGSRFDEEQGRQVVWTHVGAYLALPKMFEIVGACEPDPENAARFRQRCPHVPVFDDVPSLVGATSPDVASICTPAANHRPSLMALVDHHSLKAVWCEKPLAGSLEDAEAIVARVAERRVPLVVSHVRRWVPLWRRMKFLVESGAVGTLRCLRVAMPNRLWSIGSHAVDLALFIGGDMAELKSLSIEPLRQDGEPACAALISFSSGAYGIIQVTGRRSDLVVEAEAIGDLGRLWAREDRGTIQIERFEPSLQYAGHRQLADDRLERHETLTDISPFVEIAREISELALGPKGVPTCGGAAALAVEKALARMAVAERMEACRT